MSEGDDLSTEFTELVVKYLNDRIVELRARGWSEAEIAKIEENLKRIEQGSMESFGPTPEQSEMIAFVYRMMTKQGTMMPDFAALYRKKAELDRKMFGQDDQ